MLQNEQDPAKSDQNEQQPEVNNKEGQEILESELLNGQKEIEPMFRRLWRNHKSVKHENFYFIEDGQTGSVAVRFNVVNSMHDGSLVFKSNCNFFTLDKNLFSEVRVYMTGENTLDKSDK